MSRKKRKRGRGRVLILVVLLALIVFGVFARGIFTSGKTTTEHAQRELHTYAEQHETSLADYPDALVQLPQCFHASKVKGNFSYFFAYNLFPPS